MSRRAAPVLALLLCLAAPPPLAAQEPFTIGRVLSAPFPSGMVASGDGEAVAWVQNAEGVRNVWVATAPEFEGRRLTDYRADDGVELSGLAFTADGRRLLFVRGGDENRQGEHPNPVSRPESPEQAIWIVDLAGPAAGEPVRVAEGDAPAPSPSGDLLAFVRDGGVWRVPLPGDSAAAEAMFEMRGRAGQLAWSPDGRRLAFTSFRGDHAFVGVYDVEAERLRWLDPGVDRDVEPTWSPDGRRVAFLRLPNERLRLPFAPQREGIPWSIRVADPATGEGREVWRAPPGRGSAFQDGDVGEPLLWADGDRLVFPWEREGWLQLWSVAADGGEPTRLTPAGAEVEDVGLAPDRRTVLYVSNRGDIDRRHLWEVSAAGGEPRALTSGDGIEWSPTPLAGGRLAFLASGARRPAHAAVVSPSEGDDAGAAPRADFRPLAPGSLPEDFPSESLVVPEPVVFAATDGLPIHGQLFLPPDLRPGERRPALLFLHGGSRRQMLLGFHYIGYYHNAYALNQYLASRGYIVLSVNYRSGIGYGLDFREAIDYGARGASEFRDVLGAGLWLRGRSDVDPERIGLWGGSYGGYLTALGLARASDLFAAGVDVHGVHDWNVVIENFVPSYSPEEREEFAELAFRSSPMADIETWRSPVLLIHGDDDRNVPFSESVDLAESLRRQGVELETLVFPDEVHGFLLHRNWLAAFRATADFFDRKLDGRPASTAADAPGR